MFSYFAFYEWALCNSAAEPKAIFTPLAFISGYHKAARRNAYVEDTMSLRLIEIWG